MLGRIVHSPRPAAPRMPNAAYALYMVGLLLGEASRAGFVPAGVSLAALWTDGPWLWMAGVAYVLCFLYFGTRLSLSDIAVHRLPNRLVARWAGASAALLLLISVLRGNVVDLLWAGLGLLLLGGGYLLVAVLGRGAMGMGDVKLAGVLGLNLGYFSLGSLLLATLFAFVTASLVVLGGMLLRKLSMKSHVPFGPFMILGAAIALGMTP